MLTRQSFGIENVRTFIVSRSPIKSFQSFWLTYFPTHLVGDTISIPSLKIYWYALKTKGITTMKVYNVYIRSSTKLDFRHIYILWRCTSLFWHQEHYLWLQLHSNMIPLDQCIFPYNKRRTSIMSLMDGFLLRTYR